MKIRQFHPRIQDKRDSVNGSVVEEVVIMVQLLPGGFDGRQEPRIGGCHLELEFFKVGKQAIHDRQSVGDAAIHLSICHIAYKSVN